MIGTLNILDATGHVGVEWSETEVTFNLRPSEGKANSGERDRVANFVDKVFAAGKISGTVDGVPFSTGLNIRRAKSISLSAEKGVIPKLLKEFLSSDIFTHRLLFRIDRAGIGELIQKTQFNPGDGGKYQAAAPLRGG